MFYAMDANIRTHKRMLSIILDEDAALYELIEERMRYLLIKLLLAKVVSGRWRLVGGVEFM